MTSKTNTPPQYELKHRLTGATILILCAVLVIPKLLEQPSIQASVEATTTTSTATIFKSKIEPIDLDSPDLDTLVEQPEVKKTKEAEKPALVDSTNSEAKSAEGATSIESSSTEEQTEASETASTEVTESNENADVAASEDDNQSTAEAIAKVVEKGWAVRVGTFAKKENVSLISALLDNNGFSTNHTEVDTTLGKATRVWLGPYADKETAEKVSTRLKSITGEKGYVTNQS